MNAVTFIRNHTTQDNDLPSQDECPICLDNYTIEQCLRITNIPKCSHHIGANCLDDMLRSHSHEEKKCPLCRAVWIPARPLPILPRAQSPSASRHMAGVFAGLDGIGANIANQQLGTRRGFAQYDAPPPPQQAQRVRGEYSYLADFQVPRDSRVEQQRSPIVIDSDSDDADYETHVQNFEDFRRDIADIRSRAPYRHVSRSSRRRRVAERDSNTRNGNGGANEGVNSSRNSQNATPGLGRTNTVAREGDNAPGTGAINRFLNTRRTLNPFRPTSENNAAATPTPTGNSVDERERVVDAALARYLEGEHGRAVEPAPTRELDNLRRQAEERRANVPQYNPGIESSDPGAGRATTSHAVVPDPNTPVDMDMTSDELVELPAIQSLPAREAFRSRQLDHREANLNRREQAMTVRETTLARREVELVERETRVGGLMRVTRRHREETEELVRRHVVEIGELLN